MTSLPPVPCKHARSIGRADSVECAIRAFGPNVRTVGITGCLKLCEKYEGPDRSKLVTPTVSAKGGRRWWIGKPWPLRVRMQWPWIPFSKDGREHWNNHDGLTSTAYLHLRWPFYIKKLPGCGCFKPAKSICLRMRHHMLEQIRRLQNRLRSESA